MVPGQPSAPKHSTVDPVLAKLGRRGLNAQRYKDGMFRADRPLPPGYSPRARPDTLTLSPRITERKGGVYEWSDSTTVYETTSSNHYRQPEGHAYVVPTRRGLSPRNAVSGVSQAISGDGYLQFSPRSKGGLRINLPPLGSINGKPRAEPASDASSAIAMTDAGKIAYLEVALHHEQRMVSAARAQLQTYLGLGRNHP